jgi:GH18 family chitinase
MGADHPRRIIGYFTSWRNGANGQPSFLASDVAWDSITHINYAFAHVNDDWKVSIGDPADPTNPATGMEWSGPENAVDPQYNYKGHFNQLNKYAKQHDVKLLLSVGGWAETGGFWGPGTSAEDELGRRFNGGFYNLTIDEATGNVNTAAINTFAKSAADFVKTYDFDGIDIDYEYPSSMSDAGHPNDWSVSNKHRGKLWEGYMVLMEALRRELDIQGEADDTHYMLTIASPSSGYLLRGFETFEAMKYLDYVNIMTYDLHGAWNHFVGHNAALFDTGEDSEIEDAVIYNLSDDGKYYNAQGYLNIDWAFKYFRTALAGGRINLGLPYYTRGWQGVTGGDNGLWGSAPRPDQTECYLGTGGNPGPEALTDPKIFQDCGYGAQGIDNLWFDLNTDDTEMFAGAGPIWHAWNLRDNLPMPYVDIYGHDSSKPEGQYQGDYVEHYDEVAESSWLWNEEKKVFLSTENLQSFQAKVQYAIDQGAGGIMFWEMAGDYSTPEQNGLGYHFFGSTLTDTAYNMMKSATPYGVVPGDESYSYPQYSADVDVDFVDFFPKGEDNYPLQPLIKITNNSDIDFSAGKFAFNVSGAMPVNPTMDAQMLLKPWRLSYNFPNVKGDILTYNILATAQDVTDNVGGLSDKFSRIEIDMGAKFEKVSLTPGETIYLPIKYFMPITMPQGITLTSSTGIEFGLLSQNPDGDVIGAVTCGMMGVTRGQYPSFNPDGWWGSGGGTRFEVGNVVWESKVWTNQPPGSDQWNKVCSF